MTIKILLKRALTLCARPIVLLLIASALTAQFAQPYPAIRGVGEIVFLFSLGWILLALAIKFLPLIAMAGAKLCGEALAISLLTMHFASISGTVYQVAATGALLSAGGFALALLALVLVYALRDGSMWEAAENKDDMVNHWGADRSGFNWDTGRHEVKGWGGDFKDMFGH